MAAPIHLPNGVRIHHPTKARNAHRIVWRRHDGSRANLWRVNYQDALDAGHEIARQLDHPPDQTPASDTTVASLLEAYAADGPAVKTRSSRRSLTNQTPPELYNYLVGHVTGDHVRQHVDQLETRNKRRRIYTHLRAAWEWGIEHRYTDHNPIPKPPSQPRRKEQGETAHHVTDEEIPTTEQVEQLADAAARLTGPEYATAVRLSAYAGLRIGEIAGLAADKIRLGDGAIDVHRQYQIDDSDRQSHLHLPKGKGGGKSRTTIIPAFLDDELASLVATLDGNAPPHPCPTGCEDAISISSNTLPLFPDGRRRSTGWNPQSRLYCWFCAWRVEAGWPVDTDGRFRWTWHSLRHHFCTWALANRDGPAIRGRIPPGLGLEVADVSHFAGHSSPSFTFQAYCQTRQGAVARGREATVA